MLSVWKDRTCYCNLQYGAVCRCSHKQRDTYAPLSEIGDSMQIGDLVISMIEMLFWMTTMFLTGLITFWIVVAVAAIIA